MNHKLQKLADRRQYLIDQAALQRMSLARNVHSWRKPLAIADKGLSMWHFIKQHPILIASDSAALLSLARPNGIGKWFRRSLLAWHIFIFKL